MKLKITFCFLLSVFCLFSLSAQRTTLSKKTDNNSNVEQTAAEMIDRCKSLIDSVRWVLQNDKDIQFYNEIQSQLKPYLEVNDETNIYCAQTAFLVDSLQRFVDSKLVKGKVDTKGIDAFIYAGFGIIKDIRAEYTKYKNYMQSMGLLHDFKSNRNQKFESYYTTGIDKYFELLELRDTKMEDTFGNFMIQVESFSNLRDSLQIYDLADKKKEKELMATKIIALSQMCSNVKTTEKILIDFAKSADGYAKMAIQDAQRHVTNIVQSYQNFYEQEYKKRTDALVNYLLTNKDDLAVLLFIDHFPREQYPKLHQEVAKALYTKYPTNSEVAERYKIESAPATSTAIGSMAPDLAFENPNGQIMNLSDLKGKVVLLDFWAAWCRPCRMENPNVVKAYNKYHDKGFEVFSVSLDRDKASWVKAIQDDGLVWPNHVSDLGYWQSKAAKIYGVSSIPATFLLDRDGRIIAKNLRGAALENALKELLD